MVIDLIRHHFAEASDALAAEVGDSNPARMEQFWHHLVTAQMAAEYALTEVPYVLVQEG